MLRIVQLLGLFLILCLSVACSNSEDADTSESQTDKIAQEAIDSIKTPIDQTKVAVEALNIRNETVEGATEKVQE